MHQPVVNGILSSRSIIFDQLLVKPNIQKEKKERKMLKIAKNHETTKRFTFWQIWCSKYKSTLYQLILNGILSFQSIIFEGSIINFWLIPIFKKKKWPKNYENLQNLWNNKILTFCRYGAQVQYTLHQPVLNRILCSQSIKFEGSILGFWSNLTFKKK